MLSPGTHEAVKSTAATVTLLQLQLERKEQQDNERFMALAEDLKKLKPVGAHSLFSVTLGRMGLTHRG